MSYKIVALGEVLWDLLPAGRQLGGAPANFAYHARALGADARIVSRVGRDADGRDILEQLTKLGVPTDCVEVDDSLPTGTVNVELAADGQPEYHINKNVAWDAIAAEAASRAAVTRADAVCFGTLAQRSEVSRDSIRALVQLASPTTLRVLDVNLRQNYFSRSLIEESLALVNVIKVNDAELPQVARILHLHGDTHAQIAEVADRFHLRLVAYTRGSQGSLLFAGGNWSEHSGTATKVVDTVGAGDSFTAAMTMGFLAGWDLDSINRHANEIAAYVCSCAGGTPPLRADMRKAFEWTEARLDN